MKTLNIAAASAALAVMAAPSVAKEGMFTPEQAPEIAADMRKAGLRLNPRVLSDLTAFPMGAVIALNGCTGSFVSDTGLVVTNHHCARGSIQFNSSSENNYLEDGFLAGDLAAELPAAPGSRVYVTVAVTDVTDRVRSGVTDDMSPREQYQAIENAQKALIKECEADPGHRCQAPAFFGGLQYKLIKRLEIRDVRLVYAPGDNIGKYGGDIDNWLWPRHTGDFAFYRAYVAPDGTAADFAEENVPYQPEHVLDVSAAGLDDGDFVMAAGYPGSTSRYARLSEVAYTFDWLYPTFQTLLENWIATIEDAAPAGSDARIKYESRLAGLNNFAKNLGGQIEGAQRVGLVDRRRARETALNAWIAENDSRSGFATAISDLDDLSSETAAAAKRNFAYNNATRPQLLSAAQRLYRLSLEKQKPDDAREPGFQERDMAFFAQGMRRIDRRYDAAVDKAEWLLFLQSYLAQPAEQRVAALDDELGLGDGFTPSDLDRFYAKTTLTDAETRLALMDAAPDAFETSNDPFIKLAVALHETEMQNEEDAKSREGRRSALEPQYMEAIIAWRKSQGDTAYPDANSTLRITYGNVFGGSPKDGLIYEPFTRLEGIPEKDTGTEPFNAPQKQLDLIEAKDYGSYALRSLGTVPVNFLSDLDSTGGNSGSATLNARGQLVGLLFDGTIESVNSDWDFDPRTTRTIHVDTRYMLWVMEKVNGADRLIEEMSIVR
ncbi:MAG: S46 family peptidase [Pseudomonadota bacterium]